MAYGPCVIDAILSLKDNFTAKLEHINKSMKVFERQSKYMGKNIRGVGRQFTQAGKTMTAGITLPVIGIGVAASTLGMNFEKSLSQVRAISGASGNDMKILEQKAREMGSKTSKSAKDAADAMGYMALAGWDVKQILEGTEPVLRLAEAGNLDMARTSDLVTDSMSSLGLSTKDLGSYLDQVAKTAGSSNTNIDMLMEALIVCGGSMKNLNVPMDEANALLGILANRGTKGSEAGTALNSVLVNLTTGAGQAGKAMKSLGLSAFDNKGKFKGVTNVLKELNDKTKDMSEENRNMYLSMIGGKTQLDTLQKLLAGVGDEYGELNGKIKDSSGALEEMARVAQENNAGSLTKLKSSLEEVGLKIYDVLKPGISGAIDVIQKFVDKLNSVSPAQQKLMIGFAIFAAAIGPVVLVTGLIVNTIGNMVFNFGLLAGAIAKAGGVMAFLATPGMIVVGVVLAIVAAVALLIFNWDKVVAAFKKAGNAILNFCGISKGQLMEFFSWLGGIVGDIVGKVVEAFQGLVAKVGPSIQHFIDTVGQVFEQLKPILLPILAFIGGTFATGIMTAFSYVSTIVSNAIDTIGGVVSGLLDVLSGILSFLGNVFTGNWSAAWEDCKSIFSGVVNTIDSLWEGLVGFLTAPVQAVVEVLDSAFRSSVEWITNAWSNLKTFLSHPIRATVSLIKNGDLSGVDGKNALGTPYWGGGYSLVGENGPEILEIPHSSKVIDHRNTERMLNQSSSNININFGNVTIREEADMDLLAQKLVNRLKQAELNYA